MLGFPSSTNLHKLLPKAALYRKFGLSSAEQEQYDRDISRIYIENEISERTINIRAGQSIKSFFVVQLLIKNGNYDKKVFERLSKLIPQKMLFAVEQNGIASIAVYEDNVLMQTESASIESIRLPMSAIDLDQLWANIVSYIGNFKLEEGKTLKETISENEEIRKLDTKINQLTKRAFKEKQPRRKWELMQEVKRIEIQRNSILS